MKQKVKALFFVILALSNINILAHTIIPHHYHKNVVFVEKPQCQTQSVKNGHNSTDHHHEHEDKKNVEYCDSDQVFVIRSNQVRLDNKYLDLVDNRISLNPVRAHHPNPELINFLTKYSYNTQPPSVFSTHCQFITSVIGMRAPPIV